MIWQLNCMQPLQLRPREKVFQVFPSASVGLDWTGIVKWFSGVALLYCAFVFLSWPPSL